MFPVQQDQTFGHELIEYIEVADIPGENDLPVLERLEKHECVVEQLSFLTRSVTAETKCHSGENPCGAPGGLTWLSEPVRRDGRNGLLDAVKRSGSIGVGWNEAAKSVIEFGETYRGMVANPVIHKLVKLAWGSVLQTIDVNGCVQ